MTTPTKLIGCRIVVRNDIFGRRDEYYSPQTGEEAMENHGHIQVAKTWLSYHDVFCDQDEADAEPIGVCIRRSKDNVVVRWHVVGDPEAAWDAMKKVLADGGLHHDY